MSDMIYAGKMPVLALRGLAVFPEQTVHFDVGRVKSALALEEAMKGDQMLLLIPQKNIVEDDPGYSGLFTIGTVVKVKQILKAQNDNIRVLVTGLRRAKITEMLQTAPYLSAMVESVPETQVKDNLQSRALRREANALYAAYSELIERPPQSVQLRLLASEDCGYIADSIAQNAGFDYRDKAKLLCQLNPVRRLEAAIKFLQQEIEMLRLESDIQERTRVIIDQQQKDYYLREQMKAIREELGEGDDINEFADYEKGILLLNLPEDSETKLMKDLARLKKQPFGSSEGAVLRNYLDTVLELPWNTSTKERVDVEAARKILNKDHYGLEKVKQRILETIAVRQMDLGGRYIAIDLPLLEERDGKKGNLLQPFHPLGVDADALDILPIGGTLRRLMMKHRQGCRLKLGGRKDTKKCIVGHSEEQDTNFSRKNQKKSFSEQGF